MDKHEENSNTEDSLLPVEHVQIGLRMEKRMVKVLKGLAEYHDMSLGDLLEGIVLHSFANMPPFTEDSLQRIAQLKDVYSMDYGISASPKLPEYDMSKENM